MGFGREIVCSNGEMYESFDTIVIDNLGKPTRVRALTQLEARALISAEYGFELSSIKIICQCWYEATDWNYFEFNVKGWKYRVRNFEALELIND